MLSHWLLRFEISLRRGTYGEYRLEAGVWIGAKVDFYFVCILPNMSANTGLHILDYCLFAGVLIVSFAIGIYHAFTGGKQRSPNEILVGNRKMKTLPVALSILVSFLSGIMVLGTPAEMYTKGTQLFMRTIGYCIACLLSAVFIVPMFFKIKVTSAFEVSNLCSGIFFIINLGIGLLIKW